MSLTVSNDDLHHLLFALLSIDDKVPISQAEDVVSAMKDTGLAPVEYVVEQGKDHLYDREPHEQMDEMYRFIAQH